MIFRSVIIFFALCTQLAAADSIVGAAQKVRRDHPRLFLTRETIPAFRAHAQTIPARLQALYRKVDALPKNPRLEIKTDVIEIKNDNLIFKKKLNDQDAAIYGIRSSGGIEALECAMAWMISGNEEYRRKAVRYLVMLTEFCAWSDRYKVLPEWYNYSRMCGIVAYDWIYDTLSLEERRNFILPMLKHVEHMQNPGYMRNNGGPASGNYGEPGLQWYAGVAALHDGIDDQLAAKIFDNGFKLNVNMMNLREEISGGSGILTSVCTGYSFGAYPWSSFNFLHTLRSATGIDGSGIWTQMRDYGNWFAWSIIAGPDGNLLDFGWGDANHQSNKLTNWLMYSHLAQTINVYGKSFPGLAKQAGALMALLPERERALHGLNNFPFLPFILTGFAPEKLSRDQALDIVGNGKHAAHFPTFGLTNMRSGMTSSDTYASFRAGAKFNQHQHYDENSFIIYKKGFQALDSGNRGSAPHHRVYYSQTVAHNSILIRMDNEPLPYYWYPQNAPKLPGGLFCDGGQNRFSAASSLGCEQSAYHVYTGGDATASYAAAKCREAVRQFVYVLPDIFVVYDRVTSVKPEQEKLFLLHTQNKPEQRAPGLWRAAADGGALWIRTILPENAVTGAVGGEGREFWTNRRNWPLERHDSMFAKPNWLGRWRLEIKPAEAVSQTRFLHVLQTAGADKKEPAAVRNISSTVGDGVEFSTREGRSCRIIFNRDGLVGGSIQIRQSGKTLLEQPLGNESNVAGVSKKNCILKPTTKNGI